MSRPPVVKRTVAPRPTPQAAGPSGLIAVQRVDDPPQPRFLYKYLDRKYADRMIADGSIRIGTLNDFKAIEMGIVRGDATEGSRSLIHSIGNKPQRLADLGDSPLVARIFGVDPTSNSTIAGITLKMPETAPDVYIYCTTAVPSQMAMREFKADTCVRISNPNGFFEVLSECMRREGLSTGECAGQPCVYRSREVEYNRPEAQIHPAFIKTADYAWQREVRLAWQPRHEKLPIHAEILVCPGIRQFLTLHDVG
jgi:hypothetical protein